MSEAVRPPWSPPGDRAALGIVADLAKRLRATTRPLRHNSTSGAGPLTAILTATSSLVPMNHLVSAHEAAGLMILASYLAMRLCSKPCNEGAARMALRPVNSENVPGAISLSSR